MIIDIRNVLRTPQGVSWIWREIVSSLRDYSLDCIKLESFHPFGIFHLIAKFAKKSLISD
jgi:hypothetical protein